MPRLGTGTTSANFLAEVLDEQPSRPHPAADKGHN